MRPVPLAAVLAFLFVLAWAAEGLGIALLGLLVAAIAGAATAVLTGEMPADELGERIEAARDAFRSSSGPRAERPARDLR